MYDETIAAVARSARQKSEYLQQSPSGYLLLSALAGVYVGFGIILIFAVGAPLWEAGSPFTKVVMGASFGIALSLVIFAGSELFTGNNLVMAIGVLRRSTSPAMLGAVWVVSFAGNLIGALAFAWLVAKSGVLSSGPQLAFVQKTVETKMDLPFGELFVRGILCNWLVCLAVWASIRAQSETARLIMIFWCLFAFIGAGFEHSVANMSLLGVGLFLDHGPAVSWGGFADNLIPVTLGNIVGGTVFVGGAYWFSSLPLGIGRPTPQNAAQPADLPDAPLGEARP